MSQRQRPRHIIWITTDHLRYDCIGANGNPAVHTPNLDRLAEGGVALGNCQGQHPVCMPSRVSFMTGQYPCRTGVTCNGPAFPEERGPSCAEVFGAAGWETAQIGKLHFEPHDEMDLDPAGRRRYGFDFMALSEEPGCYVDAYTRWLRTEHPRHADAMRVPRPRERMRRGDPGEGWTVEAPAEVSHCGFVASQTIYYLRYGRPSFIHAGMYAPHPPLNPPAEVFERYRDADMPEPHRSEGEEADKPEPLRSMLLSGRDMPADRFRERRCYFYAMCSVMDSQVGRIVDALQERGELDDTLILFMSDHGDMDGDHGMVSKQHSFYDEVMHLPVILHWPNGLPAGVRMEQVTEAVDLLPTLCELAGVDVPWQVQGRSLAGAIRDGGAGVEDRGGLAMHGGPGQPLCAMLRTAEAKYIRYGPGREVLYDLKADPHEFVNRAGDASCAGLLGMMRERMLHRMLDAASGGLARHRPF